MLQTRKEKEIFVDIPITRRMDAHVTKKGKKG